MESTTDRPSSAQLKTAADVMTEAPRTASAYSTILELAMIMRANDCGAIPILEEGKPIGMVTDRDIVLSISGEPDFASRAASEIMSKEVYTVLPSDSLDTVRAELQARGVRRVLVVDTNGELQGVIAWSDLAPELSDLALGGMVASNLQSNG